ncbi:membrane protein [Afipia sp. P52-10]|jgi:outer membrane immunogenic protein|uniref:outer membrane protein n=1 Tax=Afipia sp. P52-10 TaxID=1429916 RepID=UPI0003DF176E|nr:outer membrane protein [Afipia sp. P52-10]ETR75654.1 membrane protein [Afipia sp. P52-10]
MKRVVLAAAAAVLVAAPALAADMRAPVYKAPPPAPTPVAQVYNWTGFYIGAHVGGAFAGSNTFSGNDARFMVGVQGGADYQFAPNWVVGIEAQYSWLPTSSDRTLAFAPNGAATLDNRGIGSVTGRLGYAIGPVLIYAKGGYAFLDRSLDVNVGGAPAAFSTSGKGKDGYTVGAGLEYMFAQNWSVKAEYQYYDFGRTTFTSGPPAIEGTSFKNDEHTVKAGLNYRFTWDGPQVPRY